MAADGVLKVGDGAGETTFEPSTGEPGEEVLRGLRQGPKVVVKWSVLRG